MKQDYAYVRKSPRIDRKRTGEIEETLDRLISSTLELALRHSIDIPDENVLVEYATGTSIAARPQLQSLLRLCQEGRVSRIVCLYQDRLLRGDPMDEAIVQQALLRGKVTLVDSSDTIRFDRSFTASKRLIFGVKSEVANWYVRDLVEKRREADQDRIRRNIRSRGYAPYGYRYKRKVADDRGFTVTPPGYEIIPHEFTVLKEIFDRVLAGESYRSIAENLNARGILSSGRTRVPNCDGAWSHSAVRRLVDNPFFAGYYVQRFSVNFEGKTERLPEDEWVWPKEIGDWPTVITIDQYWSLHENRGKTVAQGRKPSSILTNVLHCCHGQPMHSRGLDKAGRNRYRCHCEPLHPGSCVSGSRWEHWAKEIVRALIDRLPDNLEPIKSKQKDRRVTDSALVTAIQDLSAKTTALDTFIRRYAAGELSRFSDEDVERIRVQLQEERDMAAASVDSLKSAVSQPDVAGAISVLGQMRGDFDTIWSSPEIPDTLRNRVVSSVISRMELAPSKSQQKHHHRARVVMQSWTQPFLCQSDLPAVPKKQSSYLRPTADRKPG